MRFRSADRLTADAIGRRVTVRRRLPDGMASDVVGTLDALDEHTATVRDKHGTQVTIPRGEIIASRVITRG